MAKTKSSFRFKKFNIFVMLFLVGVTSITLVAVQQQQEVRSKAESAYASGLPWVSGVFTEGVSSDAFGTWRGRPVDLVLVWVARQSWSDISQPDTWGVLSGAPAGLKLAAGMAMLPEDGSGNYAQCATGAYDQYFKTAGTNYVKAGRGDIYVRLGWEANGNWFAWYMGSDPTNYKACFKREVQALKSTAPNLKIDWTMNKGNSDTGLNIANAYPGDDVVDVVGVDFYDNWPAYPNQAAWDADYMAMNNGGGPSGIGAWLQFAKQHGKKLSVPEWGVNNHNGDASQGGGSDDAFYIQAMFNFFKTNAADIAYESYFNTMEPGFIIDPPGINPKSSAKYQELWKAGAGATLPSPTTVSVSPTYYQLGPCTTNCPDPTTPIATSSPVPSQSTVSPQPTVFVPTVNPVSPTPCTTDSSAQNNSPQRHKGQSVGFFQIFFQFLMFLFQLFGGGQNGNPQQPPTTPSPCS